MSFGIPIYPDDMSWEQWEQKKGMKKISLSTSEYRLCIVNNKRALFHRWEDKSWVVPASPLVGGHSGGTVRGVFAIVEMEDGTVREVEPTQIRFDTTDKRFETLRRHCLGQFEDE